MWSLTNTLQTGSLKCFSTKQLKIQIKLYLFPRTVVVQGGVGGLSFVCCSTKQTEGKLLIYGY